MNIYRASEALPIPSLVATGLLALGGFAAPALAQKQDSSSQGGLKEARKVFATTDADMDGVLSLREASVAGIPSREFSARDMDKSQTWALEEFLLYYHDLLVNSGKAPSADLVAEVKRVVSEKAEAAKRAMEAKQAADLRRRARERLRDQAAQGGSSDSTSAASSGSSGQELSLIHI